jgi:hypothetical protein
MVAAGEKIAGKKAATLDVKKPAAKKARALTAVGAKTSASTRDVAAVPKAVDAQATA